MTEPHDSTSAITPLRAEYQPPRGHLKIYLGVAPGVGKTYTMLLDALAKQAQGLDVVVGVIVTHGRPELDTLLGKLETLPQSWVEYHGKPLLEFDLAAALKRKPGLLLIDEMEHLNVPGLRHAKRWQDIKVLLDHGLSVATTLNVQHIESLQPRIAQVIGFTSRTTVPDVWLASPTTVEIVDLAPAVLLQRWQEGRIYFPAQAEFATQNFFQLDNLLALRELTLTYLASQVSAAAGADPTLPLGILGSQVSGSLERLLVYVDADAASDPVIRAAARLAASLPADWLAVTVAAPRLNRSADAQQLVAQHLRLAQQLGADTRILSGVDVAAELLACARQHHVTKIVLGNRPRARWRAWFGRNLPAALWQGSGAIDIYLINTVGAPPAPSSIAAAPDPKSFWAYARATLLVGALLGMHKLLFLFAAPRDRASAMALYLFGVLWFATRERWRPTWFATLGAAGACAFAGLPHRIAWGSALWQFALTLSILSVVAYVICRLTTASRQQVDSARRTEQRTAALHALTRQLACTRGTAALLDGAVRYCADIFASAVMIMVPENGVLRTAASSTPDEPVSEKDAGVARWVYEIGQMAGLGTDTLPFSEALYLPLCGAQGPIGVLRLQPQLAAELLLPERMYLLEACANQIARSLAAEQAQHQAHTAYLTATVADLGQSLLHTLTQELQQPLQTIAKLAQQVAKKPAVRQHADAANTLQVLSAEAQRLHRLINNLLQISQLEAGHLKPNKKMNSIHATMLSSQQRLAKKLAAKKCVLHAPPQLPLLPFDAMLIEQVLMNLIDNAIQHTPATTGIEMVAALADDDIMISVADQGPGLQTATEQVFAKFYRGKDVAKTASTGLGLTLCESILKAHGGRIWAENKWDGGAIFYFVLPLQEKTLA